MEMIDNTIINHPLLKDNDYGLSGEKEHSFLARFAVIKKLARDSNSDVRSEVTQATGIISDPKFRDALIKKLAHDFDLDVRRGAAQAATKVLIPEINQFLSSVPFYTSLLAEALADHYF
jgi:HEAT repeat protein